MPYKDQIKKFWHEYLNGTPLSRFNWLASGNPAGKTIWIMAFNKDNDELIGSVSLLPKVLFINKTKYIGAIMGDLMVHKNYRVFGPTISLLKEAVKSVSTKNIDFIYTIPNSDSVKVIQRVGFKNKIDINVLIRPVILEHYINRKLQRLFIKLLYFLVDYVLALFSKQTYQINRYNIEQNAEFDTAFNLLWKKKKLKNCIFSDSCQELLKWRYEQNPLGNFKIIKINKNSELDGYLIYSIRENEIKIHSLFAIKQENKEKLVRTLLKIAKNEKCKAIYFSISKRSTLKNKMLKHGYISSKNTMQVYWIGKEDVSLSNWEFEEGDRNI